MNINSGLVKLSLLFLSTLLLTVSVRAQDLMVLESDRNQVGTLDRIAQKIIQTLPDSATKTGLIRYYSILQPGTYLGDNSVGFQNSGIVRHFQKKFSEDEEFARSAYLFYYDLRKTTQQTQNNSSSVSRHSRPSLADVSGTTRKDLPAGWLYKKALAFSHNTPQRAISLIGLCGHDDTAQGLYENTKALQKLLSEGYTEKDLLLEDAETTKNSFCPPRTADFYIANSLGTGLDISSSLKKKILEDQYPGRSATDVASKYYHVLGAAFMTCQMIEAGMHPLLASQVEVTAAGLYRGIRLCQTVERPGWIYHQLLKSPELRRSKSRLPFEQLVIEQALLAGKSGLCGLPNQTENAFCLLLKEVGAPMVLDLPRLEEKATELIEKNLEKIIASGLYTSWALTGKVAGISLPCSRDQLFGPHPFLKWLVAKEHLSINVCGSALSLASCQKALRTIRTWEVDFDWTLSQHSLGAKFASRVCK